MRIVSRKVPKKLEGIFGLLVFLDEHYTWLIFEVMRNLRKMDGKPSNSTATFSQVADALAEFTHPYATVYFEFYSSKNPFVGHNVISHATRKHTINYNTRFHSAATFKLADWVENFFHELTHLADQRSHLSFGHKDQKDKGAAPFVVGALARQIFEQQKTGAFDYSTGMSLE